MASEGGEKPQVSGESHVAVKRSNGWVIPTLRVVAFMATAAATITMAANKQTKSFVVATIGTTPVKITITAKFQHTPAFVFFVVANGMGSLHNLLMLVVELGGHKFDFKGLRLLLIPILDMMTVSLVSGGASAAAFMGELGRNGNSHARWDKICDKFDSFCDHGGGAILASFAGVLLLIILTAMSIIRIRNLNSQPLKSLVP
ncbi:hypothetical protein NMG60_11009741 [Bertholletia excelsa]